MIYQKYWIFNNNLLKIFCVNCGCSTRDNDVPPLDFHPSSLYNKLTCIWWFFDLNNNMKNTYLEIERRFLIAMPDKNLLKNVPFSEIIQTYLISEDGSTERVRKRSYSGRDIYTHTKKRRISHISREEIETEISPEQYEALLERADPRRNSIIKRRYCIDHMEKLFEIDLFSFWADRAIMEVELCRENEDFCLPPQFRVIKEITGEKRYTNASLALEIPYDLI